MTLKSILLIFTRQVTQKWGRFLLASGGIMIGVWAITLTTSLSFGVQDTLVQAINSQPIAKQITINKLENGQTDFFEIREAPKFVGINKQEINDLAKIEGVAGSSPNTLMSYFVTSPDKPLDYDCILSSQKINQDNLLLRQNSSLTDEQLTAQAEEIKKSQDELGKYCLNQTVTSGIFQEFYENNKNNWIGSKNTPMTNEIVTCFKCGTINLNEVFKVSSPEELVGKTIKINISQAPAVLKPGEILDVLTQSAGNSNAVLKSNNIELKITAVVDDRDSSFGSLATTYLDFSQFENAIKLVDPAVDLDKIGYNEAEIYTENYQDLNPVLNELRNRKYLAFSIAEVLIQSVNIVFQGLSVVLAGFGFIALIASVFGIVNVMTISVLERQKEIGILKSLGAKNFDIFGIFILESSFLGVLGWLLGSGVAWGFIESIKFLFKLVFDSNDEIRKNLTNVNITSLTLGIPWWLLVFTFGLALFFTVISGVFPALKAARENPVEVLRSE